MSTYHVNEYDLYHLFDLSRDCYVESNDAGNGSYEPTNKIGVFDTAEAAQAACDEYASKQWGDAGWFEVLRASHGPDNVMCHEIQIEEFDDDGDFVDTAGGTRSLPTWVARAMERVTRSYQAYKDYRSSEWVDLPDALAESKCTLVWHDAAETESGECGYWVELVDSHGEQIDAEDLAPHLPEWDEDWQGLSIADRDHGAEPPQGYVEYCDALAESWPYRAAEKAVMERNGVDESGVEIKTPW